jgi:hypothetical protein
MKEVRMKILMFGIFLFVLSWFRFVPVVLAADTNVSAGKTEALDKNHLEGWINQVNYPENKFRMLDPRGFQSRVITKPGMIGDYKVGDRVRVEFEPGHNRANSIEKLY